MFENGLTTRGQRQTLGTEQDQLPCWSTGPSSGDWQETETCMIRACHTPQQPPPKLSFRAPWRMGNAAVSRGNAGWTTSKSGHSFPYQNCPQGHPAKKTRGGSRLNRSSCPPDDPVYQGTELRGHAAAAMILTSKHFLLQSSKIYVLFAADQKL